MIKGQFCEKYIFLQKHLLIILEDTLLARNTIAYTYFLSSLAVSTLVSWFFSFPQSVTCDFTVDQCGWHNIQEHPVTWVLDSRYQD